jgi:hypothetical protein
MRYAHIGSSAPREGIAALETVAGGGVGEAGWGAAGNVREDS